MGIGFEQITTIITGVSVFVLAFQIRSDVKLNRYNQTFKIIDDLETMLNKQENLEMIHTIGLMDDFSERLSLIEAMEIYNKSDENKTKIYEILNFYETLSLSVFCKHIDGKILRKIAGPRIFNAYEKLAPFISIIADNYKTPQTRPYQHYKKLYDKWDKYYGGKGWILRKLLNY